MKKVLFQARAYITEAYNSSGYTRDCDTLFPSHCLYTYSCPRCEEHAHAIVTNDVAKHICDKCGYTWVIKG